jgi:hypothetical protein
MANGDEEDQPRQEFDLKLTTIEEGVVRIKMLDRINVDDVYLHLVNAELYRLTTGEDPEAEVNQLFKDFLLKERFTAGQN